ncbi:MAG: fumarylacetoacetate hydrolase family protein [Bacteroidetes bacterium]|nr:fumarylacetoacetate hydrolase family protein [Bacteroidota bacterium]
MKIICIGRNYRDHALELKNDIPTEPVIFLKPDSALLLNNKPFFIPEFSNDVHHEIELVVRINKLGRHIETKFAHTYYDEIALGIDFTARDLQNELKKKGLPWELAKAFDQSALLSPFVALGEHNIQDLHFTLEKNGQTVQTGHTADMLFSVNEIIAFVSQYFTLKIGDLIYTGTPAGVGPVAIGDRLTGYLEGVEMFYCNIK